MDQNGHGRPTLERLQWMALTEWVHSDHIGSLIDGEYRASNLVFSRSHFPHEVVPVNIRHQFLRTGLVTGHAGPMSCYRHKKPMLVLLVPLAWVAVSMLFFFADSYQPTR
jgi:hypothetical protein